MSVKTLTVAALAWACLGLVEVRGETKVWIREKAPPPTGAEGKSSATASDPAEPPVKVEATFTNGAGQVSVDSGARGTTLKLATPGGWGGSAQLEFKGCAPPMRFAVRLSRMPDADLESLTLSSGTVSLQVS